MPTDARRTLGALGERLAAEHVERLGWQIVARNFRTRFGELDLVGLDGETLVFCEVKACRAGRRRPWDSLHERKQAQVRRMAGVWLAEAGERPRFAWLRFDAIGVVVDGGGRLLELEHLEGAF